MRVLIHSQAGDVGGIAYQIQKEGAKVDIFIKEKGYRRQMDGIIPHVDTMEEGLRHSPDFVLFDLNGDGDLADTIRKKGYKVIGSSSMADKMEMDRMFGVNICKQYGIKVPKSTEFKSIDEALAHVKKENKAMAIKIDDNLSEASSYVAKDAEDMTDYLAYSKETGTIPSNATFILQEVVKGAEISTELWFCDGNPIWPANSTLETKKFLAGELGQRTGCETSLVYHYDGDKSKLVDKTIRKIFPLLKQFKWTGPIDVNCIVSETDHEPYFLEWTPRLGYSAIYAFMAMLGIPISEFFYRIATGNTSRIPFKSLWGSSLKVSIPPYPADIEDKKMSEEIYGKCEGVRINGKYGPDFIPIDVMKAEKGKTTDIVAAGTSCIIGESIGRGSSLLEAWRASQKVFKSVEVPNKGGRLTDGSNDAWERCLKLRKFGYDVPNPSESFSGSGETRSPPLLHK